MRCTGFIVRVEQLACSCYCTPSFSLRERRKKNSRLVLARPCQAIDTALRRAGRFDREIGVPVPEKAAREHILRVMCANLRMAGDFDFAALATCTPGYVGADFRALVNEAALIAVTRGFADVESIAGGLAVGLPGNVKSGGVAGNAADVVAMDVGANDADDAVNASNSHIPPSMAPVANGTVAADSHTTRVGTNVLPMGTNALPVGTAPVTVGKNALPVGATAVTVGATPGSEATSISGRGAASDALRAQQEPFSGAYSGLDLLLIRLTLTQHVRSHRQLLPSACAHVRVSSLPMLNHCPLLPHQPRLSAACTSLPRTLKRRCPACSRQQNVKALRPSPRYPHHACDHGCNCGNPPCWWHLRSLAVTPARSYFLARTSNFGVTHSLDVT